MTRDRKADPVGDFLDHTQKHSLHGEAELHAMMRAGIIRSLVNRFLAWPLPATVAADRCASDPAYPHRTGTNLLTADEARQMIEYLLEGHHISPKQGVPPEGHRP